MLIARKHGVSVPPAATRQWPRPAAERKISFRAAGLFLSLSLIIFLFRQGLAQREKD